MKQITDSLINVLCKTINQSNRLIPILAECSGGPLTIRPVISIRAFAIRMRFPVVPTDAPIITLQRMTCFRLPEIFGRTHAFPFMFDGDGEEGRLIGVDQGGHVIHRDRVARNAALLAKVICAKVDGDHVDFHADILLHVVAVELDEAVEEDGRVVGRAVGGVPDVRDRGLLRSGDMTEKMSTSFAPKGTEKGPMKKLDDFDEDLGAWSIDSQADWLDLTWLDWLINDYTYNFCFWHCFQSIVSVDLQLKLCNKYRLIDYTNYTKLKLCYYEKTLEERKLERNLKIDKIFKPVQSSSFDWLSY